MRNQLSLSDELAAFDMKQFFFYVNEKLKDVVDDELKRFARLNSGLVATSAPNLENFVPIFTILPPRDSEEYKEKTKNYQQELKQYNEALKSINLANFPAHGYRLLRHFVDMIPANHSFFQHYLPKQLFDSRYETFRNYILHTVFSTVLNNFKFSKLDISQQKIILQYLEQRIPDFQRDKNSILLKLQDQDDNGGKAFSSYLLFEGLMEWVRERAQERKLLLIQAFKDTLSLSQSDVDTEYNTILSLYEGILQKIRASCALQANGSLPSQDFDFSKMKKAAIELLIGIHNNYSKSLMKGNELSADDFDNGRKAKKLLTILSGLNPDTAIDRLRIITVMKYLSLNPFPDLTINLALLKSCVSPNFSRELALELDSKKQDELLVKRFSEFSKDISDEQIANLRKYLIVHSEPARVTSSKRDAFFQSDSDDEGKGPPNESNNAVTRPGTPERGD